MSQDSTASDPQGTDLAAITDAILEDATQDFEAFEKVIRYVLSTPEGALLKDKFAAGQLNRQEYMEQLLRVAKTKAEYPDIKF